MRQVTGLMAVLALAAWVACLPTPQCRTSQDCPPPQTCKDDGWCEYPNGQRLTLAPDNGGSSSGAGSSSSSGSSGGSCVVVMLPATPAADCAQPRPVLTLPGEGCYLLNLQRADLPGNLGVTSCPTLPTGPAGLFDLASDADVDVTIEVAAEGVGQSVVLVERSNCGMDSCSGASDMVRIQSGTPVPVWVARSAGASGLTATFRVSPHI